MSTSFKIEYETAPADSFPGPRVTAHRPQEEMGGGRFGFFVVFVFFCVFFFVFWGFFGFFVFTNLSNCQSQ